MKSIDELTHYELLNIHPSASPGEIRRAYLQSLATFGPNSLAAHNLLDEAELARARKLIDRAYQTLIDPVSRARYDKMVGLREEEAVEETDPSAPSDKKARVEPPSSFRGADLRRYRQEVGISLEAINRETKIPIRHLKAIEEEEVDRLPGLFFLKGFLKTYASCLKLDPKEVADKYLQAVLGQTPRQP